MGSRQVLVLAGDLPQPWREELGRRIRDHFFLTLLGTSAFTCVFFLGYFYVQQHPLFMPVVMPLTALDRLIPFQPYALPAYLALWVYTGAGPGLQATRSDILSYARWMTALCVTGLGIFYLLPTRVPPVTALIGADSMLFKMLQQVDATSNACPSMHVAAAIFTAIRVGDVLRSTYSPLSLRFLNAACCALICYSTLAIKQHVVLDVAAGALLGAGFAGLSRLKFRNPDTADHQRA